MNQCLAALLFALLALPATAQTVTSGQPVTVTGRITLNCAGTVYRVRQEWHTRGEAVASLDTAFGVSSSGSALSGSLDQTIDVPLQSGEEYAAAIRLGTVAEKSGSATIVSTFWYRGTECNGQRTVGSFIELEPGS